MRPATDAVLATWSPEDVRARLAAPGGYEVFAAQVRSAGCCRRPVRLVGRVSAPGEEGGRVVLFDSAALPDGVLLKACGSRRETLCPPCASLYRGDAFALVAAGLRGGKGVAEAVVSHPAVLVTLTAPSFGAVHRRQPDGNCHRAGARCRHGSALVCAEHHREDDEVLGQALCSGCYDYAGAVLFNAGVSELWRRTAIYALRALGQLTGTSVRETARTLRLSYVKVVEFQRRGSVHVHALVRVDARGDEHGPAPALDAAMLAVAFHVAAKKVSAPVPGDGPGRLRWGTQIDTAVVGGAENGRARAAAYVAKYSTKGSDEVGLLDHRLRLGIPRGLPPHLHLLAETAWRLSARPAHQGLRLRHWAHTFGYRGHFLTKSRRYSTTFRALRAERQTWRLEQLAGAGCEVLDPAEDETAGVVRDWAFDGNGYLSIGDAYLAACLAETERDARRLAYEGRRETRAVHGSQSSRGAAA